MKKHNLTIEQLTLWPNCHTLNDNYQGSKLKVKSAQTEKLDVEVG